VPPTRGEGYDQAAGLIASMERLARTTNSIIFSFDRLKKDFDRADELFGTSHKLKADIQSAITSPVLFKKIGEVLSKNLGGANTPQIKANLVKAAQFRKQYMASRVAQQKIDRRLAAMRAQRPHTANRTALNRLNQRITALQSQSHTAGMNAFKQRWAMKAALTRSKKAAIGPGSTLGTASKLGMLSKAAGFAGIAITAVSMTVEFFDQKMKESALIIEKYGRFSIGGAHAAQMMYIRDIHRNIQSSRALSSSMFEFAKANSDMKDSWKGINIVLDKLTLAIGTTGSKIASGIGKTLDPVARAFDEFMGGIAKGNKLFEGLAALGGPVAAALAVIAKAAGWKTQQEEMDELKARIERRRQAIQNGNVAGLQPGDMGAFERGLIGLPQARARNPRPVPPPGNMQRRLQQLLGQPIQPFAMPQKPGGGGNQAPGMPGGGAMGGVAVGVPGAVGPPVQPIDPRQAMIDMKMKTIEKEIRINENAKIDLQRAIVQRQENIAKMRQGGLTEDELRQTEKKQSEIDDYMRKIDKLERIRGQLDIDRQKLREGDKNDEVAMNQRRGWSNKWTDPGVMSDRLVGAHLMT
jgi:hypothetical protein